jgi:hypothetical protein
MSNQHHLTNHRSLTSALTAMFGRRIALALLVGAASLAACATTAEEDLGTSEAELKWPPNCCEGGTFTCTATGNDYDYWVPGSCFGPTRPQAQTQCEAACGAPCADTGWELTCF